MKSPARSAFLPTDGLGGTLSSISSMPDGTQLAESRQTLLSCSQAAWFWISWLNGVVTVGAFTHMSHAHTHSHAHTRTHAHARHEQTHSQL